MPSPEAAPAAVLDTNVVLDWLVFGNPDVALLVQAIEDGRLRWIGAAAMRAELAYMLVHPSLERWNPSCEQALAVFDRLAELHPAPAPSRLHCSDPDDQVFIDLALAAGARWLITRDRALLKLARRAAPFGVAIVPPARWSFDDGA